MPRDMGGHGGFVARAYGHHPSQAQPLGHRALLHGGGLRQDFPLLFFEKRDAFRPWRLRGLQSPPRARRRPSPGVMRYDGPARRGASGG